MNAFFWYPPAETSIRFSAYLHALLAKTNDFEAELCAYLGVKSCILACSGRALLTLLLQALRQADTGGRDEVLIPAYTCYSVAASVARAGLKIAVYDLEPRTLRADTASLKSAAGIRTLAIIYQHLFGIPQPAGDFRETADRHGIPLVEDAAQGLGGFLHDTPLGAMGDFSIFSFGRGKPLALGSGGALSGKKEVLDRIPAMNGAQGFTRLAESMAARVLSHPAIYGLMERLPLGLGRTVFHPGFAVSGMPEVMKRLAKSSFACLESVNSHRREIARVYKSRLDSSRTVPELEGSLCVYTRFPFFAGPKAVSRRLLRLGIRRMYPQAITDEPAIRGHLADPGRPAPGARQIAQELVTLPTHSGITPLIAHEIATALQEEYRW